MDHGRIGKGRRYQFRKTICNASNCDNRIHPRPSNSNAFNTSQGGGISFAINNPMFDSQKLQSCWKETPVEWLALDLEAKERPPLANDQCMSKIGNINIWNATCYKNIKKNYRHFIEITYHAVYVMHSIFLLQTDGLEENPPWHPPALRSKAKLKRVRWGHCLLWKETLRTDTCLRWRLAHQQPVLITNPLQRYEDMWRIYETDLLWIQTPLEVLLFDFDSTVLEVLLKGQAPCNEIDVQCSQRWKDYEWIENW